MRSHSSTSPTLFLGFLFLIAIGALAFFLLRDLSGPELTLLPRTSYVSKHTAFTLGAKDMGAGVSSIRVVAKQGGIVQVILEKKYAKAAPSVQEKFALPDGPLKNGPVELEIIATDNSWAGFGKGNTGKLLEKFTLDTVPPRVLVKNSPINVWQGGCAMVGYTSDEKLARSGVEIENKLYPGYQQPDGSFACLFPFPYFMTTENFNPRLVAEDEAGNQQIVQLYVDKIARNFRNDTIRLPDSFLNRKNPEFANIYPGQMTPLERFLKVNRELRTQNRKQLFDICSTSNPTPLWHDTFIRLPRAASKARFADSRTYMYKDQAVDKQTHLGIDLASIKNAPVPAGNTGRVVYADYLGIYGDVIILDHGLGLFSLYAHLSAINVNKGDMVKRGQIIAKTGATGMAGGDHLHFGVLVFGQPISPIEWWDRHWIKNNVSTVIPEVLASAKQQPAEEPAPKQ